MSVNNTGFQQDLSADSRHQSAHIQTKKVNVEDKAKESDRRENTQKIVNNLKKSLNDKDYVIANFLIHTIANDQQAELFKVRLFWL
jgi:hypothetical protein